MFALTMIIFTIVILLLVGIFWLLQIKLVRKVVVVAAAFLLLWIIGIIGGAAIHWILPP
jgi:hypothetical protein